MITNYKPADAFTLREEITSGKSVEFSHSNFQLKVKDNEIIHSYESIFSKYRYIFEPYIFTKTLSESDYRKYYQKPKLLSTDAYGTPELWSGLLYINNIVSVSNFTKRTIKMFNANIVEVIQEIMTINSDDIKNNKKEVYGE